MTGSSNNMMHLEPSSYFQSLLQMTGGVTSIDGSTTESHAFPELDPWSRNVISRLTPQKGAQTTSRGMHICWWTQMTRYTLFVSVCVGVCVGCWKEGRIKRDG